MGKIWYNDYKKKVRGGWLGKCLAGNMGAPLECCKMQLDFESPEEYAPLKMHANDDLDLQLVWLQVLLEKGLEFTDDDLMEAFIRHYPSSPNEYGYGKRNYVRGIHPPHSGIYANEFFRNSMGCPIRAEIWAMIHPGDPERAAWYAGRDGSLDHGAESIEAEKFIAALESLAFIKQDIPALIGESLSYAGGGLCIGEIAGECLVSYKRKRLWKEVAGDMERRYAAADCSSVFYNFSIILLALLYGEGDFEKTVTLAVNGGYDTDCTAATVGAVLGILYGEDIFDEKQRELMAEKLVTDCIDLKYQVESLEQLTEITCDIGMNGREPEQNPCGIRFHTGYIHGPALYPGSEKEVRIRVEYMEKESGRYTVHLICPDNISGSVDQKEIMLRPGARKEMICRITMAEKTEIIPEVNLCQLILRPEKGMDISYTFGMLGCQVWRIKGPYVSLYNFKKVSEEERIRQKAYYKIPSRKIYRYYDLAEAHNNFVFPEEPYIEETFHEGGFAACWNEAVLYQTEEDRLTIDEMFGFQGCCCVYAFQKLYLDRGGKLQFHIGSTTPYRLWLNGELLIDQKESGGYCPYTDLVYGDFRSGENQIVVKLLRYGEKQQFTMVMREAPYGHGGMIKTGFGYGVL